MRKFINFVKRVQSFCENKLTRDQLESVRDWWWESHDCCPEAIAADVNFVYPSYQDMQFLRQYS